jgi:hypothetical protein
MSEASGAEAHRANRWTIRASGFLPECADGTCVCRKDARDIQVVPVHRRGFTWFEIEEIDRESVRSKEFPALRNLCIRYRDVLGVGGANAQCASPKKE